MPVDIRHSYTNHIHNLARALPANTKSTHLETLLGARFNSPQRL